MGKFLNENIFTIFQIVAAIIAAIATVAVFVQSTSTRQNSLRRQLEQQDIIIDKTAVELGELLDRYEAISNENIELKNELAILTLPNSDDAQTEGQVQIFESRLQKLENATTALRQSINPIEPDEILTIARLKDKIVYLQEKFQQIQMILIMTMRNSKTQ